MTDPCDARRDEPSGIPEGTLVDRRLGLPRRDRAGGAVGGTDGPVNEGDSSDITGLERRRGRGRRRGDFRSSAEEGEMTQEQFLFLMAIEAFKKSNAKMFPTWSDVLEVVRLLGYRKTMASEVSLPNAEDWREAADAPSGVRPQGWERRFSGDELKRLGDAA